MIHRSLKFIKGFNIKSNRYIKQQLSALDRNSRYNFVYLVFIFSRRSWPSSIRFSGSSVTELENWLENNLFLIYGTQHSCWRSCKLIKLREVNEDEASGQNNQAE